MTYILTESATEGLVWQELIILHKVTGFEEEIEIVVTAPLASDRICLTHRIGKWGSLIYHVRMGVSHYSYMTYLHGTV